MVLRVDYARWGQTPEDLRHLALSAPHARTRERALALFDITQHSCATQVAGRTGRRAHTVLGWVHVYNTTTPTGIAFWKNASMAGGPAPVRAYIDELLPDVLEGRIEPGRVFDRTGTLEEVPDGYRAMNDRDVLKFQIVF